MAILQVRSMDDELYGALGRRAAMENRSISQEVISIIKAYLASPRTPVPEDEVLTLAGSWDDTRSAAEIVEEIRAERSTTRFQGGF